MKTKMNDLEVNVTEVLVKLGCPANLKGYYHLRAAIQFVAMDVRMIENITKQLYKKVAEQYSTTISSVDRSIHNAIDVIWERANKELLEKYFYYCVNIKKHRPTNGEFIAAIADSIRLEMKMREFE